MTNTNYPKYQYSIFLRNGRDEQLVIRADEFEDLIEAKKNIDRILEKVESRSGTPRTVENRVEKVDKDPAWIKKTDQQAKTKECQCGAIKTLKQGVSKEGKPWAGWFCDDRSCSFSPEWVNLTKK